MIAAESWAAAERRATTTSLIWITHDLAIVSGLADRLAVMYAGRIVETGPTPVIVGAAQHPYTHGLIASIPSIHTRGRELFQIPGSTPSLLNLPEGCPFRNRCYRATEQCRIPGYDHLQAVACCSHRSQLECSK